MKLIRTGIAVAVLALLPEATNAGLIQYGFQISGAVYPTPNSPSPGLVEVVPASGTVTSSDPNNYTVLSSVTMTGWQNSIPNINGLSITNFNVVVGLTDISSGQSGTMGFHGDAWMQWGQPTHGVWTITNAGIQAATSSATSLILGTNRYTVTMGDVQAYPYELANPSQAQPLSLNEVLSISPIPTPEPSTLLLAVCGLPLLGFFFRRSLASSYS